MNESRQLLLHLINAGSATDRERQLALLEAAVSALQSGESLDQDAFELLVEDTITKPAISSRKAARLLADTGVFRFEDGTWRFCEGLTVRQRPVTWETLASLFQKQTKQTAVTPSSGEDTAYRAIVRAIGWNIDMTLAALRGGEIDGQPAFYSCDEDGDHLIGFAAAGTATSDSLSMLCGGMDYLPDCGKTPEDIFCSVSFLLEKTLLCQCAEQGWDHGGFYPLEDQPDATHPTVDATCLAVMALCAFFQNREALEKFTENTFFVQDEQVMRAVLDGLDFLTRMQCEDGSFGIYAYEDGRRAAPNENCTRIALSTMGVCKGSGIFDRLERFELYPRCSGVIERAYRYLTSHMARTDGEPVWAPYFGERARDYPVEDVLVSSARVCRAWIPVWWQMEEERSKLLKYCESLVSLWEREFEQSKGVGLYRFNTPTNKGFSDGEYFWASHPHMLTAFSVLQAYNLFGLALTKQQWSLIERAVRETLAMQHPSHGHWDNPLAKKTPFCAVTLAAIELLQEYRKAKGWTK